MKLSKKVIYIVIHSHKHGVDVEPCDSEDLAQILINEIESGEDFDSDSEFVEMTVKHIRID